MFDCPMNDHDVTTDTCNACGYQMETKKCGFVKDTENPKRGNGEGDELYKVEKREVV